MAVGGLALLAIMLGSGCHDTMPACVPRSTEACFCNTGGAGQQVCDDDGLDHGPCTCLPDAGTPDACVPDAGEDAQGT